MVKKELAKIPAYIAFKHLKVDNKMAALTVLINNYLSHPANCLDKLKSSA